MRFKEFLQAETDGIYGPLKGLEGELGLIKQHIKLAQPVKKGTTVGRMMSAGPKLTQPAKPAQISLLPKKS
jgi:hypothetical protein